MKFRSRSLGLDYISEMCSEVPL